MSQSERVAAFRALHESGCFVIPNPWDIGTARLALEQFGFPALATTSAGMAWSLGRADNQVSAGGRAGAPAHDQRGGERAGQRRLRGRLRRRAGRRGGERHRGSRDRASQVCRSRTQRGDPDAPLFELPFAVERIRAARAAIDASGSGRHPRRALGGVRRRATRISTTRSAAFARIPRPAPTVSTRRASGPRPRSAPSSRRWLRSQ